MEAGALPVQSQPGLHSKTPAKTNFKAGEEGIGIKLVRNLDRKGILK